MAEFTEVMRQWKRYCKSHAHCGECKFDGKGICGEAHLSETPYDKIEREIMAWAAEHPEPMYPTWAEWLVKQGTITQAGLRGAWRVSEKPIPADIAEKLGIEPKEDA